MKKNWKANLKVLWILFKVRVYTLFTKSLKVSFKKVYGSWYCDIPGWPQVYFPNSLMVGDASSLISAMAGDRDYITSMLCLATSIRSSRAISRYLKNIVA